MWTRGKAAYSMSEYMFRKKSEYEFCRDGLFDHHIRDRAWWWFYVKKNQAIQKQQYFKLIGAEGYMLTLPIS